ncbi:peroxisomal and mitochondrial division factor 1-like [Nicotiana sylvestris]|uniref:peroxisomal and mitochondrial division factor 1-like n=1 Tax=Nicotiana sylvestris TaxID=4096 RepID=UPI00388C45B5
MSDAELSLSISGMALQTLIMGIEHDRRDERRTTVFKKKEEELARKVKELKERDEELMKDIGRCNELEATLKAKEDELEMSKGVMAENTGLQARVASLTAELGQREMEAVDLRSELSVKVDELTHAEKGRVATISEVAALDDALRVFRSERDNEVETLALKVARLEERIQDLEAELYRLNELVVAMKAEKV